MDVSKHTSLLPSQVTATRHSVPRQNHLGIQAQRGLNNTVSFYLKKENKTATIQNKICVSYTTTSFLVIF